MSDSIAKMLVADEIHLHWLTRQVKSGRQPLKAVLGLYLGLPMGEVAIVQTSASSKPVLADRSSGLQFNWSHSGDRAVVAVAQGVELGVDLEARERAVRTLALAERFFSAQEYRFLLRLPESRRSKAFLRLWTGKEAVLKALGRGIADGLDRVVLAVSESDELRIEQLDLPDLPSATIQLQAVAVPYDSAYAALAWHGPPRSIRHFRAGQALPDSVLSSPTASMRPQPGTQP